MNKKRSFSIMTKLMLMTVLPVLVLGTVLCIYSSRSIKSGMDEEALSGLQGAASGLKAALNSADEGDFTQDADGNVYKGSYKLTGNNEIMDSIKSDSGYDVTFFYGDTRVATSIVDSSTGERIVGTQCTDKVKAAVLEGGNVFQSKAVTINSQNYYVCYMPLTNADGSVAGMAFAGIPSAKMEGYITKKTNDIIIISVLLFIFVFIFSIFSSKSLAKAVVSCQKFVQEIADGNLSATLDAGLEKRSDEIGNMAHELSELSGKLKNIVNDIKKSSDTILSSGEALEGMASQTSQTSDEISKAVEDISKGAVSQAEEIETASKNVGNMGTIIEQITDRVEQLDKTSVEMKSASDQSTVIINDLSNSNDKTTDAVKRIAQQINTTNESAQTIREAVELITAIAEETSLLSLNASIEAARAGEHGRGFAVVATEIQKLADQSSNSAKQIEDVIDVLLKESEASVKIMTEVETIVDEQQKKLTETKEKFSSVTENVNVSHEETTGIKNHTVDCNDARSKVVDVISNLSAISEENAASTEETTASMQELNATINILAESATKLKDLSVDLQKEISFFKL